MNTRRITGLRDRAAPDLGYKPKSSKPRVTSFAVREEAVRIKRGLRRRATYTRSGTDRGIGRDEEQTSFGAGDEPNVREDRGLGVPFRASRRPETPQTWPDQSGRIDLDTG